MNSVNGTQCYLLVFIILIIKLLTRVIFEEGVESEAGDLKFPTDGRCLESVSSKLKVLNKIVHNMKGKYLYSENGIQHGYKASGPPHIELYGI